ncbi:MAG TPA: MerR family transcriptional regulator [Actinocatenispora sp.]
MRIGELSHRTGVSVRLLRYYEAQGLLAPTRTSNRYREYGPDAPELVARIRCLLAAGLSTRTIAEVLPCLRDDGRSIAPTCPESRARIATERDRVATTIDDLRRSLDLLSGIVTAGA